MALFFAGDARQCCLMALICQQHLLCQRLLCSPLSSKFASADVVMMSFAQGLLYASSQCSLNARSKKGKVNIGKAPHVRAARARQAVMVESGVSAVVSSAVDSSAVLSSAVAFSVHQSSTPQPSTPHPQPSSPQRSSPQPSSPQPSSPQPLSLQPSSPQPSCVCTQTRFLSQTLDPSDSQYCVTMCQDAWGCMAYCMTAQRSFLHTANGIIIACIIGLFAERNGFPPCYRPSEAGSNKNCGRDCSGGLGAGPHEVHGFFSTGSAAKYYMNE